MTKMSPGKSLSRLFIDAPTCAMYTGEASASAVYSYGLHSYGLFIDAPTCAMYTGEASASAVCLRHVSNEACV